MNQRRLPSIAKILPYIAKKASPQFAVHSLQSTFNGFGIWNLGSGIYL